MEAARRKAESGGIWKYYGKNRENDGKGDWKWMKIKNHFTGFTLINIRNDVIYLFSMTKLTGSGDCGMIIAM